MPQTIVRKNALFAGSGGGENTLERIANRWSISQIDQLMP